MPILFQLFHKIKTERTLPISVCKATVTLISKPHKNSTKKENFRPISFMNIDAKYSIKYSKSEPKYTLKTSSMKIK